MERFEGEHPRINEELPVYMNVPTLALVSGVLDKVQ